MRRKKKVEACHFSQCYPVPPVWTSDLDVIVCFINPESVQALCSGVVTLLMDTIGPVPNEPLHPRQPPFKLRGLVWQGRVWAEGLEEPIMLTPGWSVQITGAGGWWRTGWRVGSEGTQVETGPMMKDSLFTLKGDSDEARQWCSHSLPKVLVVFLNVNHVRRGFKLEDGLLMSTTAACRDRRHRSCAREWVFYTWKRRGCVWNAKRAWKILRVHFKMGHKYYGFNLRPFEIALQCESDWKWSIFFYLTVASKKCRGKIFFPRYGFRKKKKTLGI